MKLEALKTWFDYHMKDKDYQHRDLPLKEFDKRAFASFDKLKKNFQTRVMEVCRAYKIVVDDDPQTVIDMLRYRFMAQTNLFALCHLLEKYADCTDQTYTWIDGTTHDTHQSICNSFFVRKDPTVLGFKNFATAYADQKQRLLLVPRGGFKSSIDMADTVQYIINWPEVTIIILTGVLQLAKDFVSEIKGFFKLEDGDEESINLFDTKKSIKPRTLTDGTTFLFQCLFAEHCIAKDDGKESEFQTPASDHVGTGSTVWAASIDQNLSGWHAGVMKLDDVVTNENSRTVDRIININKQVSINKAMLVPYGFYDKIGTWYDQCLAGDTPVTMSDWSQKSIKDITVGDIVVGWNCGWTGGRFDKKAPKGRSRFVKSEVLSVSVNEAIPVNKYTFASGRSVVATPDHLWWNRKNSYGRIGLGYQEAHYVRRAFIPTAEKESLGWLAGIFDGEGTVQPQRGEYPSATLKITQTLHNPRVVETIREELALAGFSFREKWTSPKNPHHKKKCDFIIEGGWGARYKFLQEVSPIRRDKISSSLFSQVCTTQDALVSVEPAGTTTVYCIRTATGNYLADGCCSHNCDTYGQDMKHIALCVKQGDPVKTKVYLRPAWWPNLAAAKAGKVESEMLESDWELWFNAPGQLTYEFLKGESHDVEGFAVKYLNDPTKAHVVKFPRELLVRKTINSNLIPQMGLVVTCIDTAYSVKSWADFTVIITALIYGGRFYIIDMKRGRFNEIELPCIIASVVNQWRPSRLCIEDSVGVKWLGKEIYKEMDKLRVRVPIEFVPLGQGNKANAKDMKAKPVLRYLGDDRLLFANQCVGLEDLYTELSNFGTAAGTHDDIVSALSILVDQFSSYADMEGKRQTASPDFVISSQAKQQYDHIYGKGSYNACFTQKSANMALNNPDLPIEEAVKSEQATSTGYSDPFEDAGLY